MNTAHSVQDLDKFLEDTIKYSSFNLQEVKFSEQNEWNFKDGALSHKTGGFFDIIGIEDSLGTEHLLLYQPQSALTGLAICRSGYDIYILLQARIEPGNSGIGQYGPTIQSTPANFSALHGGNKTSALDLFYGFNNLSTPIGSSIQLDLGERYFHKSKWHNYVMLENLKETDNHMIWVNLKTIKERIAKDNYLNADLRSLLAIFNWDKIFQNQKTNIEYVVEKNPLLNRLLAHRNSQVIDHKIKDLEDLKNWQNTPKGIISNTPENVSLKMYHTSCGTREVGSWYQPLMLAQSKGLVILKVRKVNQDFECLLTLSKEIGIDSGYLITATNVINPGESTSNLNQEANTEILHEFVQSDEGGRFYKHESIYQILLVEGEVEKNKNQFWVSFFELKGILAMSNMTSFQLRCISSLLLFYMNGSLKE